MTAGFRVMCSDGVSRHDPLFRSQRDALTWVSLRHVCYLDHTVRREATWRVSEFRLVAGAVVDAPKHPRTPLPDAAPATTPLSVVNAVFGKEPAHA